MRISAPFRLMMLSLQDCSAGRERGVGLGVLLAQEFERAAGERETEAEGRAARVLLEDFDRDIGPGAFQAIGEIETRGSCAQNGDAHRPADHSDRAAMISAGIG